MENKWGKKREGRCKLMIHRGGVTVRTVRFYHLTAHCGRWQMNWKPSYQQQRPGTHNLIELKTVHPSRGYSFLSWEITRGCAPSFLPPPFRPNISTKPDLTAWKVFAGMISFFFSSTNVKIAVATDRSHLRRNRTEEESFQSDFREINVERRFVSCRENCFFFIYFSPYA